MRRPSWSRVPSQIGSTWRLQRASVRTALCCKFEGAYDEGGLFLLTMHPHVIGYRSRMFILEELIRHMQSLPGVWFGTHRDVAQHVKKLL